MVGYTWCYTSIFEGFIVIPKFRWILPSEPTNKPPPPSLCCCHRLAARTREVALTTARAWQAAAELPRSHLKSALAQQAVVLKGGACRVRLGAARRELGADFALVPWMMWRGGSDITRKKRVDGSTDH